MGSPELRFVRGRAAPSSALGAEDASIKVSSAWAHLPQQEEFKNLLMA